MRESAKERAESIFKYTNIKITAEGKDILEQSLALQIIGKTTRKKKQSNGSQNYGCYIK